MPTRTVTSAPVTPAASYSDLYALLRARQKPGPGVPAYTRWPNRAMARAITPLLFKWGWSPNMVTVLSLVFSASAMAVLILGERTWATGIIVAFLLAVGFVLDSADGQLARLSGQGGPAGEWFDHVADAIRTPALHISVAVAFYQHDVPLVWVIVPLVFTVLSAGQFMSQILAEQLRKNHGVAGAAPVGGGYVQSWILLPTDTGTMCWLFVLWGFIGGFEVSYLILCALIAAHSAVSMRRRFTELRSLIH